LPLFTVSILLYVLFFVLTIIYKRERGSIAFDRKCYPRVSILKPIKGIDDGFEENLSTFLDLDYPDYEVLIGLDNCCEGTREAVKKMCRKYPEAKVKIYNRKGFSIFNPKIEVLSMLEKHASGKLFWIADANTRVERDTLQKLVGEYLVNGSKIVYSPIIGTGSRTFASAMENAYLNYFVSGSIIAANSLAGQHVIVGKSMLIEKEALQEFGGFRYFRKYLAEDFMMGKEFVDRGMSVSTNYVWVTNYVANSSILSFAKRMARWAKLRFHINPAMYVLEVLANPLGLSILALLFAGRQILPVVACVVAVKLVLEYASLFLINTQDRKKVWVLLSYPFIILLKDLVLFFYVYFVPFVSRTVYWKGKFLTIGKYSMIVNAAG
jgi:ceramide glucosyltransferase